MEIVFADITKLRRHNAGVGWAPKPIWPMSLKDLEESQTHRGEGSHARTETETAVVLPQAEECLGPWAAGRHREGSS